ncbi:hypothetical protein EDD85DRAFT_13952 [Armillaria nabsnona]|nr:hypothetical protein EDD85DRAFT_13952 [Armillaria nabsnona]
MRNGGQAYHDYLKLKTHGAETAKQIIELTKERQCCKAFDKDVSEGAKEKLGRYFEELPSEKDGWVTTDGLTGMQLADWSSQRQVARCIRIGSSQESFQGCSRRTLRSGCMRACPVSPSTTSSTCPAAISAPNILSTLPTDGRPTSRHCRKRLFSRVDI